MYGPDHSMDCETQRGENSVGAASACIAGRRHLYLAAVERPADRCRHARGQTPVAAAAAAAAAAADCRNQP
jgi:hypothetical protein